jgi:hypothetical protein
MQNYMQGIRMHTNVVDQNRQLQNNVQSVPSRSDIFDFLKAKFAQAAFTAGAVSEIRKPTDSGRHFLKI